MDWRPASSAFPFIISQQKNSFSRWYKIESLYIMPTQLILKKKHNARYRR